MMANLIQILQHRPVLVVGRPATASNTGVPMSQQDLVDCNDNYYCKNYYGENESLAQDLLLRTGCDDSYR
jgi:hypothetical protein